MLSIMQLSLGKEIYLFPRKLKNFQVNKKKKKKKMVLIFSIAIETSLVRNLEGFLLARLQAHKYKLTKA